jgi:hypothetical protein
MTSFETGSFIFYGIAEVLLLSSGACPRCRLGSLTDVFSTIIFITSKESKEN